MMFDNSPVPQPSTWAVVRQHIPLVLLAGGFVAAFIGLHTAAQAVVGLGLLHLAAGGVLLIARAVRNRRRKDAA